MGLILTARDAAWQTDLWVFHLINGRAGNWALDWGAIYASRTNLFGAIIMAAYWCVWFLPGPPQGRREKIVLALIGAIITLIVARSFASILPYRVRPLYALDVGYLRPNLPSGQTIAGYEDWSSFPSDQAALFFALAAGLWRCSRPLGVLAILVATFGVCAVRIYLGIHYLSDVITGAAIGVLCVYATGRIGSNRLTRTILAFERDFPPAFYAAMFLVTFEIGSLFDDVRQFMHGVLVALRASGMHSLSLMGVLAIGVGTLTAISLAVGFIVKSRIGKRGDSNPDPVVQRLAKWGHSSPDILAAGTLMDSWNAEARRQLGAEASADEVVDLIFLRHSDEMKSNPSMQALLLWHCCDGLTEP